MAGSSWPTSAAGERLMDMASLPPLISLCPLRHASGAVVAGAVDPANLSLDPFPQFSLAHPQRSSIARQRTQALTQLVHGLGTQHSIYAHADHGASAAAAFDEAEYIQL